MSDVIKVTNLRAVDDTVTDWLKAVEAAVAEAAVGLAHQILKEAVETSPQYSGDFAANWKLSVNAPSTDFKSNAVRGMDRKQPFKRGDMPAITYALSKAKLPKIKLGDVLYVSNSAFHEEPYAIKIEKGMIKFRDVNYGSEAVLRRASALVSFNYTNIGPVQLDWLRKVGV